VILSAEKPEQQLVVTASQPSLAWHRWDPENYVPFKKKMKEGHGEECLAEEFAILGYDVELITGAGHDITTSFGTVQVKQPDTAGKVVTAKQGHISMSWIFSECQWVYKLGQRYLGKPDAVSPPFTEQLAEIGSRLESKTTSITFWEDFAQMTSLLNIMFSEDPELLAELHEWIADPFLFGADACCAAFASEAIRADVVALVCEEGYTLVGKQDIDKLLIFRGDTWNGRPKFTCSGATSKQRKKIFHAKQPSRRSDKIRDIERLTCLKTK